MQSVALEILLNDIRLCECGKRLDASKECLAHILKIRKVAAHSVIEVLLDHPHCVQRRVEATVDAETLWPERLQDCVTDQHHCALLVAMHAGLAACLCGLARGKVKELYASTIRDDLAVCRQLEERCNRAGELVQHGLVDVLGRKEIGRVPLQERSDESRGEREMEAEKEDVENSILKNDAGNEIMYEDRDAGREGDCVGKEKKEKKKPFVYLLVIFLQNTVGKKSLALWGHHKVMRVSLVVHDVLKVKAEGGEVPKRKRQRREKMKRRTRDFAG